MILQPSVAPYVLVFVDGDIPRLFAQDSDQRASSFPFSDEQVNFVA